MPQIDSNVVSLLAGILAALAQLIKGVILDEEMRRYLPLAILFLAGGTGLALGFYYGRDPVAGVVEGIIAGLTALGLYATGKSVAPSVVNGDGWIRRKG